MGFKQVYSSLREAFPQIDLRLLKAVANEHTDDIDSAAEFVIAEILPLYDQPDKVDDDESLSEIQNSTIVARNMPTEKVVTAKPEPRLLDFELDVDDLMDDDEDNAADEVEELPKLSPTINDRDRDSSQKTEERGVNEEASNSRLDTVSALNSLNSDGNHSPVRSIEGWIILATGVHEEAQEDDLLNAFGEFGQVKNLHLNLDRRTGYVKGYAFVQYENVEEAQAAITMMDGAELLTKTLHVDWAFSKGPLRHRTSRGSPDGRRSRSPPRRR